MIKEIIATGKDVSEAKENAKAALGVGELDDVKFEILHMGSRGIFGIIGVKPAQVKASIEIPDREERRPRRERPKKENAPKEAPEEKVAESEGTEAPKPKKHKKHKKSRKGGEAAQAAPKQESKPKSEVIPEVELKMELREVKEGEDMSFDFISTVIRDIGLSATAELYACEDGTRRIAIKGDDASVLIGHHGDTLDALQYLANLASAKKNANGERDKSRVTLDIEGYRAKREETLRALARKMAAKALRIRRSVTLEPMSAYERRIIHSEIQGIEGVSTNSIGSDSNRKIVIFLTDKKPEGIFEEEEVTTPLTEEFKKDEDDVTDSIGSVEAVVTPDTESSDDVVALDVTHPDESEEIVVIDDSDIK